MVRMLCAPRLRQISPISLQTHIMNATRIIAHELQTLKVRGEANLSMDYCQALEMLLDYLRDSSLIYPQWADTHTVLKDPLTTALNSLVA
ncbi:hypothetical protein DL93DRAFT_414476 [Clavulina sp. PMI_390]|nr:hypothetical protein DL93DRAFT_414476 [Clavulina sp. PMI_390]